MVELKEKVYRKIEKNLDKAFSIDKTHYNKSQKTRADPILQTSNQPEPKRKHIFILGPKTVAISLIDSDTG